MKYRFYDVPKGLNRQCRLVGNGSGNWPVLGLQRQCRECGNLTREQWSYLRAELILKLACMEGILEENDA